MAMQDVGRKVLARAAAQLGSVEALAAELDMSPRLLNLYMTGSEAIPDTLMLRAIDVILAQLPDQSVGSTASFPPAKPGR